VKPLQRTLAILASLFLVVQTVRHAYVLWLEPRGSVLDKYDRPLKDEIAAARSVDELVARYEPIRKEVDRVKADRRATDPKASFEDLQDTEPFRSESSLREAIQSWEERAKEIHSLRFYWVVGLLLVILGAVSYLRLNPWVGMTFLIAGFSEIIYWTSPTFLGAVTREFDRLLVNKLALSLVSLALLALTIRQLRAFSEGKGELK
jgi:Flp pilus assembly protein TadB